MRDFEVHTQTMFKLIKDYAESQGLLLQLSALLLVREVSIEVETEAASGKPLRMAILGEDASMAIQTIQYAIQILTVELHTVAQQTLGHIPEA